MALITHLCSNCGHPGYFQSNGSCGCGCKCTPLAEPTVRPTFDEFGKRVERIIPPGESVGALKSHDCADCKALYERVGGVA